MKTYCKDKVAVVTGAGGTLCSAIAKDLARQGAKVVLIGRTREKLEKVAAEIMGGWSSSTADDTAREDTCPHVVRIEPADVTDEKAMQNIADRVAAEWGLCRFLVNGAGGNNVKAMPTRLRFCEKDLESSLFTNDNCHNCPQIANANVACATGSLGVSEKAAITQNLQTSKTPSSESNISPVKKELPVDGGFLASAGV